MGHPKVQDRSNPNHKGPAAALLKMKRVRHPRIQILSRDRCTLETGILKVFFLNITNRYRLSYG